MPETRDPFLARARHTLAPYVELAGFLKPYWPVFAVGSLSGIGFGVVSGMIPVTINFVGKAVFSSGAGADLASRIAQLGPFAEPLRGFAVYVLRLDDLSKPVLVGTACLLIPAIMLLRSLFDFLNNYCSEWTSQRVVVDLRAKVMENLMAQSVDFFNTAQAGNLLQRVVNETRAVQSLLNILNTQLIAQPATLISGLIVLLRLDWRFTIGALLLLPLCVLPSLHLSRKIRTIAGREDTESRDMMVILHEMITGVRVIKAFARTDHELARFNASGRHMLRHAMRVRRLMETSTPIIESLAAFGIALGLFYVFSVGMSGSTFLALCAGIYLLYSPIKTLTKTQMILAGSHVVVVSVWEMLHRRPTVADRADAILLTECRGTVAFENVSFGYRAEVPALRDITFRFEKGKYYALVGESGAGKTTLLSLVLRFYDPDTGRVTIDGHDLRDVAQDSLRRQIGVVSQETFLFHDTIRKNIAYGRLEATEDEIVAAAKRAHAHDFILAQHAGYDTVIGDKGCMLSGGQQQRIAIARALLKDAPILLLDEATSALDSGSERHILEALATLTHGRTVIAIAHRLSTIQRADEILVLERGVLRESGSHQELLGRSPIYRRLYDLQFHPSSTA